jgi:hypothetical protein
MGLKPPGWQTPASCNSCDIQAIENRHLHQIQDKDKNDRTGQHAAQYPDGYPSPLRVATGGKPMSEKPIVNRHHVAA